MARRRIDFPAVDPAAGIPKGSFTLPAHCQVVSHLCSAGDKQNPLRAPGLPMKKKFLTASDDDIKAAFRALRSPRDVAALLEVQYSNLTYLVYRSDPASRYRSFSIPKRKGDARRILVPNNSLGLLQKKLNQALQALYKPKGCVQAYVADHSIVTNALHHVGRRNVLTIDLHDFFGVINYGRVRGMFMGRPYSLPPAVATLLAAICCHDNQLPQGAPTSPTVSNMVCARLDGELRRLSVNHRCAYSRYADDLAFSFWKKSVPEALAIKGDDATVVGPELEHIVISNGFAVNPQKITLANRDQRQRIAGVTVNLKPNLARRRVRQVRAMLHAWGKWGLEAAEREHFEKYDHKIRRVRSDRLSFRRILLGKIEYIGMVRNRDSLYAKLVQQFVELDPASTHLLPRSLRNRPRELLLDSLWILESTKAVGTAFRLAGVGLVTCNHVIGDDTEAFQASRIAKRYPIAIVARHPDIDLAIVSIESAAGSSLEAGAEAAVKIGDEVAVGGFPSYRLGNSPYYAKGHVTSIIAVSGIQRFGVTMAIVEGNSGGPVVDRSNRVVGVAVSGADSFHEAPYRENSAIPIDALKHLS